MNRPYADVLDNRIVVFPTFADTWTVAKIPEGRWDGARSAWSFPATERQAELIRGRIAKLATTDAFEALLHRPHVEVAPAPAPAPVAEQPEPLPKFLPAEAPPKYMDVQVELPPGMKTAPWPHQKGGFKFCIDHFAIGMHGILLAMGMGTGKTLVAFLLMLHLKARRTMIIAPLRVVQVWLAQIGVHVGIDVLVVALDEEVGSVAQKQRLAEEKMRLAATMGVPFIVVINYDSAWREPFASWAERILWDLVIADEAHRMKSPSGRASKWFKRLRIHARHRIALTGTPMPHGPMDVFALFRFLDTSIFGPVFTAFRAKYAVMGGYQRKQITGYQNMEDFEARLSKTTFRVGKEVLTLPPEMDVTYYCELGPEGRRVYRDVKKECVAYIGEGTLTAQNAMVAMLRLHQVANGIAKTDDGDEIRVDESKRRLLEDTLEDIGNDEAIVVFCRFRLDLDAVHDACRVNGYTSLELSGRRDELKQWQDGKAQVLAVQISAGGVGVDLTRARYSIYYSIGFALADYMQARSRVHRPGQTRPVEHVHLLAKNTVDVKIMNALERRAEVVEAILAEIRN